MPIDWDAVLLSPLEKVFAELIHYAPATGAPYDLMLVYDEANRDLELAGGSAVNSSNPIVSGRIAAFQSEPLQGDLLTVDRTGERFEVKDVDTDGKGSVKLALNFVGG